ncbi:MAG: sodium:proton antiporter [Rhodanobacter sp. 68-29]|uniref:cation:proton antiporter n=1 Tax=Rhodanobacter sp. PCA2 TaxID=2006117 RepID=UPI00086C194C|nr:sodium:proton antiporter [Rhodanobacter sp. PCA2]MBA2079765.1 sodium:proton antiporter [Rhodanobacter sp. PCA2]MBN8923728.1 sodium:proton antiporter [Rhodanobacter sp.]ODU75606.1 MAG: sodium:proton antiporter [Rhodanobacter sp. SCN 69-32]OJY56894.1 MAG: sodium:proton antiporter [Rhodanobacter sp. 68-29]
MSIEPGLVLTGMLVVGFLCQWLAWRVKLPAIVFLLLAGLLLGPVSGLLHPDQLLGPLLFPMVSLAVALILFEGSLSLRFHELPGIGSAVRGLVSYGALVALLLLALAAHVVAGAAWPIALLFGALTCVTGPTVIAPMLRTLRPNARIANTLRWEGIVIDPLGALFAVLIYEAVVSRHEGSALGVFAATVGCGVLVGALAALLLGFLLRRQLIPEYLQNYGVLAAVLFAFVGSNAIAHESGLLTVTIMGIALGNMRGVHIDDILDFKEHLTTLLVSLLFILLAARLPWPLPGHLLLAGLAIFLFAQFVVRPVTVLVSSFGSALDWRERALIGWVAPRGIVAASVSALFALRLQELEVPGAEVLVPLVFILIIGTVVLQSATARPLALWLKVAEPEPNGVLIFGADAVARGIGGALHEAGFRVVLADDDYDGIRRARMEGLATFFGNPASPHAERQLDLAGIGRLLAMSTHRERNSLVCVHYREEFGREKVHRLRVLPPEESAGRAALAEKLLAPPLFDEAMTHARFAELLARGWRIKSTRLSSTFDWPHFIEQYGPDSLLLFGVEERGALRVASARREPEPRPGWTVIALVPPERSE